GLRRRKCPDVGAQEVVQQRAMLSSRNVATLVCVTAVAALLSSGRPPSAQTRASLQTIAAGSPQAVRAWDAVTASMLRSGELRVRNTHEDTLLPGHVTERADQYYRGVRVFGGDISPPLHPQGA